MHKINEAVLVKAFASLMVNLFPFIFPSEDQQRTLQGSGHLVPSLSRNVLSYTLQCSGQVITLHHCILPTVDTAASLKPGTNKAPSGNLLEHPRKYIVKAFLQLGYLLYRYAIRDPML